MKVLITGDIHNGFGYLNTLLSEKKADLVICCGDFGYWPRLLNRGSVPISNIKLQGAKELRWCDGNHEDFESLDQRVSDEIEPGIIYMPRGSTYTLPDGRVILFMGGAESIDKLRRTIGISWFPQEIITQSDFHNLPNIKVDIFITHTCPIEILPEFGKNYPEKMNDPSSKALSELWKIYKPDLWFFGHFHKYAEGRLQGTKWYSLSAPTFGYRWWMWLPKK